MDLLLDLNPVKAIIDLLIMDLSGINLIHFDLVKKRR